MPVSWQSPFFDPNWNPLANNPRDNPLFYNPTLEELERGVTLHASSQWGARIRKEKSLRIAFVGGSQTALKTFPRYCSETEIKDLDEAEQKKVCSTDGYVAVFQQRMM